MTETPAKPDGGKVEQVADYLQWLPGRDTTYSSEGEYPDAVRFEDSEGRLIRLNLNGEPLQGIIVHGGGPTIFGAHDDRSVSVVLSRDNLTVKVGDERADIAIGERKNNVGEVATQFEIEVDHENFRGDSLYVEYLQEGTQ